MRLAFFRSAFVQTPSSLKRLAIFSFAVAAFSIPALAAEAGLALDEARRILWMYTSRDVYRMLVQEGGWTPARYEAWLSETLVAALVKPALEHTDAPIRRHRAR